jgi:DNA-binding transcriptional LysR family regulator
LRLDVRCRLSVEIQRALERGQLDLALYKRDTVGRDAIAVWPEQLRWVASQRHSINFNRDPVPLVMFDQGCLYRNRMIHAIEAAARTWHIAYTSPNLPGIQAAVSAGLGISILPEIAILSGHRVLKATDGFPRITNTELALVPPPTQVPRPAGSLKFSLNSARLCTPVRPLHGQRPAAARVSGIRVADRCGSFSICEHPTRNPLAFSASSVPLSAASPRSYAASSPLGPLLL